MDNKFILSLEWNQKYLGNSQLLDHQIKKHFLDLDIAQKLNISQKFQFDLDELLTVGEEDYDDEDEEQKTDGPRLDMLSLLLRGSVCNI